ncbi:MAG: FAD-dependent oxidoreductase [Acidimicrobiales bacterium]|nr:FAD-dependent oxidoreductase [Acidimicrobiales bacterium]MDG1878585.1 FAD-dependent oxidoreductase [Acidimicrobiales bacterium]
MSTNRLDVAVIGRGMIGAAAGRHLAEAGHRTALIGPGEPEDRHTSQGPFCSHPDEGRITRIAARTQTWSDVAALSIERYPDIATRSGISFHTPCGFIAAYHDAPDWVARAAKYGSDARLVDADWVRETTGIAITNGLGLVTEGAPAGHINPRRLVAAQTELARLGGANVIDAAVQGVVRRNGGFEVTGPFGAVIADRILVATGAFGAEMFDWQLAVERRARSTVMARLANDGRIPCLILDQPPDDRVHEIYWVPPVEYPDGSVRIKIGGNRKETILLEPHELTDWFHGDGDPIEIESLTNNLSSLLPDAPLGDIVTAPCVITGTPTGAPYIGWIDDGVAVAIAGNGSAAKSSDELGRLGATLFSDAGWDSPLDPANFSPQLL